MMDYRSNNNIEEWRDINGYNGRYQISNFGNVRNKNGFLYKATVRKSGYCVISLRLNGNKQQYKVHRLVAETFIPNPNNLPQINHKDENKLNNRVDNLEWCTAKYNVNYGTTQQRRMLHYDPMPAMKIAINKAKYVHYKPVLQFSIDGTFIKQWDSATHYAKANNIKYASAIGVCCKGKRKTAYGYVWRYAER